MTTPFSTDVPIVPFTIPVFNPALWTTTLTSGRHRQPLVRAPSPICPVFRSFVLAFSSETFQFAQTQRSTRFVSRVRRWFSDVRIRITKCSIRGWIDNVVRSSVVPPVILRIVKTAIDFTRAHDEVCRWRWNTTDAQNGIGLVRARDVSWRWMASVFRNWDRRGIVRKVNCAYLYLAKMK